MRPEDVHSVYTATPHGKNCKLVF